MLRSPVIRISLGLALLTCAIMISVDLVGLMPRPGDTRLESRIRLCEAIGAQAAAAAERNDIGAIRSALHTAQAGNDEVLSAGLRASDGDLLAQVGNHRMLWDPDADSRSASTHASVPLYRHGELWGTIEVRFESLGGGGWLEQVWSWPLLRPLVAVGLVGFVLFTFYMRRTLSHLDPSAVIPTRVQAALDVMAGGVVVLDENERIVMANAAFALWAGKPQAKLLGLKASEFGWTSVTGETSVSKLPWVEAIRESETITGVSLLLPTDEGLMSFHVNGAPVLDGWGRAKGAIATFSDVTELERKTSELERALTELEKSQQEIQVQNEELQLLARRDPLTGVANRRAFMAAYQAQFEHAQREEKHLSVVMVDIDLFKKVNDTHGHAMGDEVIQRVSEALGGAVRSGDGVCRYGGEEFCIAMPGAPIEAAAGAADRLRAKIASPGFARIPVTASFGVSCIEFGATKPEEMINQADEALYVSKETGRNRVTRWDQKR